MMVIQDGALDVHDGLVAENEIGACIQVPGYSIERLIRGVDYRDNGYDVDLDATDLPAPQPIPR